MVDQVNTRMPLTLDHFCHDNQHCYLLFTGGGCLLLRTSKLLHLDGLISASGHSATSLSGGGSGGSVLIETTNMTGHGDVAANGGNGNLDGGGGAGGRIGVHVDFRNNYGGKCIE